MEHDEQMILARYLPPLCRFIGMEFLPHPETPLRAGEAPRAARSVHLGWPAPDSDWFYREMTVQESVPGSYFMARGWNAGYFGIQELARGRKLVIFSVWDPSRGDNPNDVAAEDRVELVSQRPDRYLFRRMTDTRRSSRLYNGGFHLRAARDESTMTQDVNPWILYCLPC